MKIISIAKTSLIRLLPEFAGDIAGMIIKLYSKEDLALDAIISGTFAPPIASVHLEHGQMVVECNPEYINKFEKQRAKAKVAYLLLHELLHIALFHGFRSKLKKIFMDPLWAMAMDIVVDKICVKFSELPAFQRDGKSEIEPFELYPEVHDRSYDNCSVEEVYEKLKRKYKTKQMGNSFVVVDSQGRVFLVLNGNNIFTPKDHLEVPNLSSDSNSQACSGTFIALVQFSQRLKQQGTCPGMLEELLKEILRPRINVEAILGEFCDFIIQRNAMLTWTKRSNFTGMLHNFFRDKQLNIIFVVDTSGSMEEKELAFAYGLLADILDSFPNFVVHHYQMDAQKTFYEKLENEKPDFRNIKIRGRGGTVFKSLPEIVKRHAEAHAVVFVSDLEADFGEVAPTIPVLWIATSDKKDVPFGTVIPLEEVMDVDGN